MKETSIPDELKNSADYDKLRDEYFKTQAKQEEKKQDK